MGSHLVTDNEYLQQSVISFDEGWIFVTDCVPHYVFWLEVAEVLSLVAEGEVESGRHHRRSAVSVDEMVRFGAPATAGAAGRVIGRYGQQIRVRPSLPGAGDLVACSQRGSSTARHRCLDVAHLGRDPGAGCAAAVAGSAARSGRPTWISPTSPRALDH